MPYFRRPSHNFFFDFSIGMTSSATEAAFQLCPDIHTQYFPVLQLGDWAKKSKVSHPRKQQRQLGIEPGTF